jgi:hypothetical protein
MLAGLQGGSLVSNELSQLLLGFRVEVPHGLHVDPGFLFDSTRTGVISGFFFLVSSCLNVGSLAGSV